MTDLQSGLASVRATSRRQVKVALKTNALIDIIVNSTCHFAIVLGLKLQCNNKYLCIMKVEVYNLDCYKFHFNSQQLKPIA